MVYVVQHTDDSRAAAVQHGEISISNTPVSNSPSAQHHHKLVSKLYLQQNRVHDLLNLEIDER